MPLPLIPLLITPLALSIAGWMGFRNTNKTTSTSKEIAEQQQSNQLKLAYLNVQAQKNLEENRQRLQVDLEMSRQQFQERMSYFGFKQQLTLREFDQQFQSRLRELDHQHQQEVEEFRAKVSVAINQKNLDFQAWKFEQEMTLQNEMALFNRETQLAVATFQRETALQLPEINKIYENWPLKLLPSQILNSHPNHLRIFISPPELDYDRFINLTDPKSHSFPRVESFLGTRLLKLLNQHYPRNDGLRPTQLLDEAWDSKRFAGSSSIVALADRLESEPFMVLETKVTVNKYVSLRVAYKGIGQKDYSYYDEVIPRFEYGDILLAAAKARIGETAPADTQKIQVTPDDWEVLYEVLEVAHCIVAAWIADVHHLIYYNASPLLPQLLLGIVRELPNFLLTDTNSVLIPLMREVVKGYQVVFQQLEKTERRYQVPELLLNLAQGAVGLLDKSLSKKLADESMQSWLQLRGMTPNKDDNWFNMMKSLLTSNDKSYLEHLKCYLSLVEDNQNLVQVESFLETSEVLLLKKMQQQEIVQPNQNSIVSHFETTNFKQEKMMDFRETKFKALSVIDQLRSVTTVSVRNILKDINGKFQKDLVTLEDQIKTVRFTVGVVGVFNTGKSTFLNALLHRELLSTKILPETAAITSLNYGEEDKATVYYWTTEDWKAIESQGKAEDQGNKPSKITKMVSEVKATFGAKFNQLITRDGEKIENIPLNELDKYTSANAKGGYAKLVREVEISTNLKFCKDNIQIVDTPGLNDPVQFREHVTVDRFLPRCDMLVLLLPARQVFTKYDKEFLEKQLKKGQLHKLFVIVNQIDSLQANENVEDVIDFARNQLQETFDGRESETVVDSNQLEIFPISAYQSFLNRTGQPANWTDEQSGVPAFETRLHQFLFEGERARKLQEIWQSRLKSLVAVQFTQIDEQLVNLDKPVKELEEIIKGVKREHDYVRDRMERVSLEVDKTLKHFEDQYGNQAEIMSGNIKNLAIPIGKEAEKKVDQFLDKNVFKVIHQTEKWCKGELGSFLEKTIKEGVEDVISDTGKRVQQLVDETLKDFQTSWNNMANDVTVHLPVKTSVGGSYASLVGNATLGFLGSTAAVGGVMGLAGVTPAAMTALLAGPMGWVVLGIGAIATVAAGFFAAGHIKEKIRSQIREKLSQEVPNMMGQIADETRKKFMGKKYDLVRELRKVAEAPALEIKAQLQQQEANLNQLLNDKKSQEVDIQKQREALVGEKARFEKVLVEINAMG